LKGPLVVGLVASPERISEIRRNRMLSLNSTTFDSYVDLDLIKEEMAFTKRLCSQNRWQVLDVTRKSIEESAASIISLHEERCRQLSHPLAPHP
jgi:[pyruvate, water dikinase]-phosphate phosphotransferase / [pyruvate, water dikinase] kinase